MLFGTNIDSQELGWQIKGGFLTSIMMNAPPAPENILKIIFCSCKNGCGSHCGCRKIDFKKQSILKV